MDIPRLIVYPIDGLAGACKSWACFARWCSFGRYLLRVTNTHDLTLELPEELYERLKARAKWHLMTPEEFVRALIEEVVTGRPTLPR